MLLAFKNAILPIFYKMHTTTFGSRQHNPDF